MNGAITETIKDKRCYVIRRRDISQPLSFLVEGGTKSKRWRDNEGREEAQTKKETGHPSARSVVVDEVGKHDLLPARTYLPGWRRGGRIRCGDNGNERKREKSSPRRICRKCIPRNEEERRRKGEYKKIRCLSSWQSGSDRRHLRRNTKGCFSRTSKVS